MRRPSGSGGLGRWLALPLALAACSVLVAAGPTFWTVATQSEFLKGDVENLSIDADGRVFLGPAVSQLAETAAPFLWTVMAQPDGTLFAGSGNEGKVLRVGRDGKVSTFFDAAELEVHAIAPAPNGALYVATSPDGRIYRVAPDGTSTVFFDPDDRYIWALAVDRGGNVFAATGDKGVIYRITPAGVGTLFYKASATNVVSLAIAPSGDLIAGTESPGRVFRLDSAGKPFVLLDSPFKEIHAVRVAADGTIYAAAMNGAGGDRPADRATPDTDRPPVPNVTSEITTIGAADSTPPSVGSTTGSATTARPRGTARGTVYRIKPDGFWDAWWETGADAPFDILLEPAGSVLVGTGTDGKIFRVTGDPARATLLARAAARQVTALLREPSGRIVGATSNPGKLVALGAAPAAHGTYESDVRDAGSTATWGIIRWRGTARPGQVVVTSRSGNTATPDETWSAWSAAYTSADGSAITSPHARFLQWRAVMTGDATGSPALTSVTTAYLPRNLRPEVESITVHPPGVVFQRPFSTGELEIAGFEENTSDGRPSTGAPGTAASAAVTPALGRRIYQKGLQTLVWKAEDPNDDRLQYDVLYRREDETDWHPVKQGLWDPIVVWDTTSVPDGTYLIKVRASDAGANAPSTALTGEMESSTFDVDNTPPVITLGARGSAGGRITLAFVVTDGQSAVQRVEYSLDASRWEMAYPKDGIADSSREEFEVVLPAGEAGRNLIIRATDAMNNTATAVAPLRQGPPH